MTHLATLFLALIALPAAQPDDVPLLIDFSAEWCGPCQQMRPAVEKLEEAGYPVRVVDFDQNADLARRYGVESVPTFIVVDPDGNELDRLSGARPARELAEMYNAALTQLRASAQPAAEPSDVTEADEEVEAPQGESRPPRPWETVVRIKIYQGRSVGFGSGTIISSTPDEAIILTCAHIFKVDGARRQYSPSKFPFKIQVDLFDGQLHGRRTPQVHPVESVRGEAIDYDFATDVGLVRIRPGRRLPSSPIVRPDWRPKAGMPMITMGCSEGNDATAWSTTITDPTFGGRLVGQDGYSAIECLHAPKQGRSGGGLYTTDGYLAGVCDFAAPADQRGLYAHPTSIYRLLNRNELAHLYNPQAAPGPDGVMLADRGAPGGRSRPVSSSEGSEPAVTLRAQDSRLPGSPTIPSIPDPDSLNIDLPPLTASAAPRADDARRTSAPAGGAWLAPAGPRRSTSGEGSTLLADTSADPSSTRDSKGQDEDPTGLVPDQGDRPLPVALDMDPRASGAEIPDMAAVNDEDVPPLPRVDADEGPVGGWKRVRNSAQVAGSR